MIRDVILKVLIFAFLFAFSPPLGFAKASKLDDVPLNEQSPPAHRDTLFLPSQPYDGYYGLQLSLESGFSKIDREQSRIDGIGVAVLLDHKITIGLSSHRLASPLSRQYADKKRHFSLVYHLVEFAWLGDWKSITTSRTSFAVGRGRLSRQESSAGITLLDRQADILVGEFKVGYYLTLTQFLRLGLDLSYRYVAADGQFMRGTDVSGLSYALVLRGGSL